MIGGWGRGFEIIQGRLGPGRIHHCMRSIGIASRALDLMLLRVTDPVRVTFGKALHEHGTIIAGIAQSRMEIDMARMLVLSAALQVGSALVIRSRALKTDSLPPPKQIDLVRAKGAMKEIGMAKVRWYCSFSSSLPSLTLSNN